MDPENRGRENHRHDIGNDMLDRMRILSSQSYGRRELVMLLVDVSIE